MSAPAPARPKVLRFSRLEPRPEHAFTKIPTAYFDRLPQMFTPTEVLILGIIHSQSAGRTRGVPVPIEISCAQIAKLVDTHRNTVVETVRTLAELGLIGKERAGRRTNRFVSQPDNWGAVTREQLNEVRQARETKKKPPVRQCKPKAKANNAGPEPEPEPEPEISVVVAAGEAGGIPFDTRDIAGELTIVNQTDVPLRISSKAGSITLSQGEEKAIIRNSDVENTPVADATCTVDCADTRAWNEAAAALSEVLPALRNAFAGSRPLARDNGALRVGIATPGGIPALLEYSSSVTALLADRGITGVAYEQLARAAPETPRIGGIERDILPGAEALRRSIERAVAPRCRNFVSAQPPDFGENLAAIMSLPVELVVEAMDTRQNRYRLSHPSQRGENEWWLVYLIASDRRKAALQNLRARPQSEESLWAYLNRNRAL